MFIPDSRKRIVRGVAWSLLSWGNPKQSIVFEDIWPQTEDNRWLLADTVSVARRDLDRPVHSFQMWTLLDIQPLIGRRL
jgi:hypothetical protein